MFWTRLVTFTDNPFMSSLFAKIKLLLPLVSNVLRHWILIIVIKYSISLNSFSKFCITSSLLPAYIKHVTESLLGLLWCNLFPKDTKLELTCALCLRGHLNTYMNIYLTRVLCTCRATQRKPWKPMSFIKVLDLQTLCARCNNQTLHCISFLSWKPKSCILPLNFD